jgi:hypothetical protein
MLLVLICTFSIFFLAVVGALIAKLAQTIIAP